MVIPEKSTMIMMILYHTRLVVVHRKITKTMPVLRLAAYGTIDQGLKE